MATSKADILIKGFISSTGESPPVVVVLSGSRGVAHRSMMNLDSPFVLPVWMLISFTCFTSRSGGHRWRKQSGSVRRRNQHNYQSRRNKPPQYFFSNMITRHLAGAPRQPHIVGQECARRSRNRPFRMRPEKRYSHVFSLEFAAIPACTVVARFEPAEADVPAFTPILPLTSRIRQASPAICCASVARYRQPR